MNSMQAPNVGLSGKDFGNKEKEEYDICPKCKKKTVRAKGLHEGGGVECINPKCDYWFCY